MFSIQDGLPYPLGATCRDGGVNFALFSANAKRVELCLFDALGQTEIQRIDLTAYSDQVWHVFVEGLSAGSKYGYRVHGPYDPPHGHRFNAHKLLIDPYAKQLDRAYRWHDVHYAYELDHPQQDLIIDTRDNASVLPKCVVADADSWIKERPDRPVKPNIPWEKTLIYETHVKGFTQLNLALPAEQRGTFSGLANSDVLAYIKSLGVSAIELLPSQGFIDEYFLSSQGLSNFWGYNTLSFFAPHQGYFRDCEPSAFLRLADAVHDHGMELILDVVFNHTCEGNHLGPTLSFRGIDNASYYCLQAQEPRYYDNDTGCGNTLNVKHPRVLQMVMDSLRYWTKVMGVDGFRFDLATVMGRESYGFDSGSGFFDAIRQDPDLAGAKLIAEPWDIGPGGYQLGNYPSGWSEWNDRYRDTVRRFWKGEPGILPEFARRIHGSSDLFEHSGRTPFASINFITSHDGFTLDDLVSYNHRHNEDNKEQNRDGHHANFSYNFGVEGETDDPDIISLRQRQKRNFLATLFFSQGVPMVLAGDELGHSQKGNNNAYCQDNEISWLDWQKVDHNDKQLQRFVATLSRIRKEYPILTSSRYIHTAEEKVSGVQRCVRWFNAQGEEMQAQHWNEHHVQSLGWLIEEAVHSEDETTCRQQLLIIFNAGFEKVDFVLPKGDKVSAWQSVLDTTMNEGLADDTLAKPGCIQAMVAKSLVLKKALF